jgi:hypothetical protein
MKLLLLAVFVIAIAHCQIVHADDYGDIGQIEGSNFFYDQDSGEAMAAIELGATESQEAMVAPASFEDGNMKTTTDELNCTCETYNCLCQKECLCKIVEADSYKGARAQPAASPPVKAGSQPQSSVKKAAEKLPPFTFKCACDFGGREFVVSKQEGLDCECSTAKCTCEKRCACKMVKDGAKPDAKDAAKSGEKSTSDKKATANAAKAARFRQELQNIDPLDMIPQPQHGAIEDGEMDSTTTI